MTATSTYERNVRIALARASMYRRCSPSHAKRTFTFFCSSSHRLNGSKEGSGRQPRCYRYYLLYALMLLGTTFAGTHIKKRAAKLGSWLLLFTQLPSRGLLGNWVADCIVSRLFREQKGRGIYTPALLLYKAARAALRCPYSSSTSWPPTTAGWCSGSSPPGCPRSSPLC